MKDLLIRPADFLGESRQGYLLRLTELNALGTPRRVKKEWFDSLTVTTRLRGPIAGLGPLNSPDPGGLRARYWNTRRPRYCPRCLDEAPYWRSVWGLVFYVACPHHNVGLVDDCRRCGRPLRWARGSHVQCGCGADLRSRTPPVASDRALSASRTLASVWNEGRVCAEEEVGPGGIDGLLYRTWLLGSYQSQAANRAQKLAGLYVVAHARRIVESAAEVTSGGAEGYFAFLDQVAARYGAPTSMRLSNRFGAFYNELFGTKAPVALSDLREAFEQYVKERWPGQIAERNRRLSPEAIRGHVWVPVTRAAKQLRWSSSRLRELIADGVVRGHLRPRASGRVAGVVHREDLERLNAEIAMWVDLATACKVLRLGKKSVRALVSNGQLVAASGPSVNGRAIWQFRRSDIESLSLIRGLL